MTLNDDKELKKYSVFVPLFSLLSESEKDNLMTELSSRFRVFEGEYPFESFARLVFSMSLRRLKIVKIDETPWNAVEKATDWAIGEVSSIIAKHPLADSSNPYGRVAQSESRPKGHELGVSFSFRMLLYFQGLIYLPQDREAILGCYSERFWKESHDIGGWPALRLFASDVMAAVISAIFAKVPDRIVKLIRAVEMVLNGFRF